MHRKTAHTAICHCSIGGTVAASRPSSAVCFVMFFYQICASRGNPPHKQPAPNPPAYGHGEGDFWLKQIKNAAYSDFLIIIGLEMKTYRQKALQAKAVSPTDKNDTEIC